MRRILIVFMMALLLVGSADAQKKNSQENKWESENHCDNENEKTYSPRG